MPKIVRVRWVDSSTADGWRSHRRLKAWMKAPLELVTSVGILMKKNKRSVVIIQSHSTFEVAGILEIPTACVKSMKVLDKI